MTLWNGNGHVVCSMIGRRQRAGGAYKVLDHSVELCALVRSHSLLALCCRAQETPQQLYVRFSVTAARFRHRRMMLQAFLEDKLGV